MITSGNVENDDVAQAAARDVARLLDRRGLRDVVELARRVLGESLRESVRAPLPDRGPASG
ncbi:hypothetical protein [Pseudonocardia sp. MH-G8]|uniref:hypothetical protein n=1 Tax=Pseudonocardia sp. MH-G8 TaxID=1854588 RepID=UPI000BA1370E|nr:hypothetical protein [Pseudonocardia sp. MH-G8]OZM78998.1 hypothetical protein CFP66_27030 [Pseudonocardia sp. MH-G8]